MKTQSNMLIAFAKKAVVISQNKFGGIVDVRVYEYENDEIVHQNAYIKMMLLEKVIDGAFMFYGDSEYYYATDNNKVVESKIYSTTIENLRKIFIDFELEDIQLLDALSRNLETYDKEAQILYNRDVSRLKLNHEDFQNIEWKDCTNVGYYFEGLKAPKLFKTKHERNKVIKKALNTNKETEEDIDNE